MAHDKQYFPHSIMESRPTANHVVKHCFISENRNEAILIWSILLKVAHWDLALLLASYECPFLARKIGDIDCRYSAFWAISRCERGFRIEVFSSSSEDKIVGKSVFHHC